MFLLARYAVCDEPPRRRPRTAQRFILVTIGIFGAQDQSSGDIKIGNQGYLPRNPIFRRDLESGW